MCYLVGVLRNLLVADEETRARVHGDEDHHGHRKGKGKGKGELKLLILIYYCLPT